MYFVTASLPAILMPSVLLAAGLYLPLGSVQPPRIDHQHGLKTRYSQQPACYTTVCQLEYAFCYNMALKPGGAASPVNSGLPIQVFFLQQKSANELRHPVFNSNYWSA
jgi:hypothetical protein